MLLLKVIRILVLVFLHLMQLKQAKKDTTSTRQRITFIELVSNASFNFYPSISLSIYTPHAVKTAKQGHDLDTKIFRKK